MRMMRLLRRMPWLKALQWRRKQPKLQPSSRRLPGLAAVKPVPTTSRCTCALSVIPSHNPPLAATAAKRVLHCLAHIGGPVQCVQPDLYLLSRVVQLAESEWLVFTSRLRKVRKAIVLLQLELRRSGCLHGVQITQFCMFGQVCQDSSTGGCSGRCSGCSCS